MFGMWNGQARIGACSSIQQVSLSRFPCPSVSYPTGESRVSQTLSALWKSGTYPLHLLKHDVHTFLKSPEMKNVINFSLNAKQPFVVEII
jgi:hypothetical protein